jgi:hypothetical protein
MDMGTTRAFRVLSGLMAGIVATTAIVVAVTRSPARARKHLKLGRKEPAQ